MTRVGLSFLVFSALISVLIVIAGCGSGSDTPTASQNIASSGSNVLSIVVNTGPDPNEAYVDGAFATVTVCTPGSTTSCQSIGGILVDTGSVGLRILSSAMTIPLTQQTDSSGNPIAECLPFVDGVTWGAVETANVTLAGEQANSIPIQVIGAANVPNVPEACTAQGETEDTLDDLGANGILGVGNFVQDCGTACEASGTSNPGLYYTCPSSGCVVTEEAVASQVSNPVASFATDNNGVIVELPAVSGAEASVTGSLVFGIGTQSNNGLGSATVYGVNSGAFFNTVYKGTPYSDTFIDSGSNGIYFLNSTITGFALCASPYDSWYCPPSTQSVQATNQGTNGATGTVTFSVGNADTLLGTLSSNPPAVAAVQGLAGPGSTQFPFDWGLPFFFGRNVYTAIEGRGSPAGPYWAY